MLTRIGRGGCCGVFCWRDGSVRNNLKPIEPVALQSVVEALGKELLLPGTMVLLRTPQGNFVFSYGATELGGTIPPRADTHFRIASNTKTMTAAVIAGPGRQATFRRSGLEICSGRNQWRRHHDQ